MPGGSRFLGDVVPGQQQTRAALPSRGRGPSVGQTPCRRRSAGSRAPASTARRAGDARPGGRPRLETGEPDGKPARLAQPVRASGEPVLGGVDLGQILACLAHQRVELGPLEGDGRAFWVVLVVGVGSHRRCDELVEATGEVREHAPRRVARRLEPACGLRRRKRWRSHPPIVPSTTPARRGQRLPTAARRSWAPRARGGRQANRRAARVASRHVSQHHHLARARAARHH